MIKTYIIDDELPALQELEYLLKGYPEIKVAGLYEDPLEALRQIERGKPDLIFLDIDMPKINGIELALQIQSLRAGIIIVFVSAYSEYSLEAFKAYPLDYILKPIDEDRFRQTMEHIQEQYRLRLMDRFKREVLIRCFGRFDVVKNTAIEEHLKISNRKLRELFAYLVHRFGKPVTRSELLHLLFGGDEDKKTINYLHVTVYNLRNMLESFGIDRSLVLIKENYTLEIAAGICDYVDFVNFLRESPIVNDYNIQEAERIIGFYKGAYLEEDDYDWAIETRQWLEKEMEKLLLKVAGHYFSGGQAEKAQQALQHLIEVNPLSEEGHQALLDLLWERQERGKYMQQYQHYVKILQEELSLEPPEEYVRRYLLCKK